MNGVLELVLRRALQNELAVDNSSRILLIWKFVDETTTVDATLVPAVTSTAADVHNTRLARKLWIRQAI